jgi:hypothetical protein
MTTPNFQPPTPKARCSAVPGEKRSAPAQSRRRSPRWVELRGLGVGIWKLGVIAAALVCASSLAAQQEPKIKPSQHGSVTQRIADTTITVDYNRPVARGRELFGKLVPYGRIWCPCADDATTLETSTAIKIDGQDLPAGKYSVWTEPGPDSWTVIVSKSAAAWHTKYPQGQDALRLQVTPRTGSHMETLAFYFPMVDGRKAELVLHWGTVVVPLAIEVP